MAWLITGVWKIVFCIDACRRCCWGYRAMRRTFLPVMSENIHPFSTRIDRAGVVGIHAEPHSSGEGVAAQAAGRVLRPRQPCATPENALWRAGLRPAVVREGSGTPSPEGIPAAGSESEDLRLGCHIDQVGTTVEQHVGVETGLVEVPVFRTGVHTPTGTSCSTRYGR